MPWTALADRCWNTVKQSGRPNRIRPGFWDNNARCCGTAGVLALACDRIVERGDDFGFAASRTVAMIELWPSVGGEWRLGP